MLAPAGLEHELHRGLAHVEVDALADVLDLDQVRALVADEGEQPGQRSRAVGEAGEQHEPPARLRLVAAGDRREHPGVDVAAGEDDARRPRRRGAHAPRQQRGHADRPGALDDELRPLEQHDHRLGDLLLADDHDVVDPALDERRASARRAA